MKTLASAMPVNSATSYSGQTIQNDSFQRQIAMRDTFERTGTQNAIHPPQPKFGLWGWAWKAIGGTILGNVTNRTLNEYIDGPARHSSGHRHSSGGHRHRHRPSNHHSSSNDRYGSGHTTYRYSSRTVRTTRPSSRRHW